MKAFLPIVFVVFASVASEGSPSDERRYQILKCQSYGVGTVWMTFGRMMSSSSPKMKTFVTELAYFGNDDTVFRKVYLDFQQALREVDVRTGQRRLAVDFPENGRKHSLTLVQYGDVESGFMGNWAVTREDKQTTQSEVACSVY